MAIDVPTKRCRPMGRLGFPCSLSVSPYLLFSRRARFHKCYRILSITVRSSLEVKSYVQMLLQCFALPFENYAHGSLAKALFKPLSLCIWLVCTVCSLKVCFKCKIFSSRAWELLLQHFPVRADPSAQLRFDPIAHMSAPWPMLQNPGFRQEATVVE